MGTIPSNDTGQEHCCALPRGHKYMRFLPNKMCKKVKIVPWDILSVQGQSLQDQCLQSLQYQSLQDQSPQDQSLQDLCLRDQSLQTIVCKTRACRTRVCKLRSARPESARPESMLGAGVEHILGRHTSAQLGHALNHVVGMVSHCGEP